MREFKGRVVTPGMAKAEAVVTHGGFNTLASLQKSLQFGDKTAKCNDQNNPDLYGSRWRDMHFVCRRRSVRRPEAWCSTVPAR